MNIPIEVKELILGWKCKYGAVYASEIEDQIIIYRGLTLKEMTTLQDHARVDDIFDTGIVKMCVLYPDSLTFQKYSSYSILSQQIRESSGWEDPENLVSEIKDKRAKLLEGDIIGSTCNILAEFFGYTHEDVKNMTFDQFTDHCAKFEVSTGKPLFQPVAEKPQDRKSTILQKLGARKESPVDVLRSPINVDNVAATEALRNAIKTQKSAGENKLPPRIFDWESDLRELNKQMSE